MQNQPNILGTYNQFIQRELLQLIAPMSWDPSTQNQQYPRGVPFPFGILTPEITVADDRLKAIAHMINFYLSDFKNTKSGQNCNIEIESKVGRQNVKENREVPPETSAILKQTLNMNPNWQIFIGPEPSANIVNPFFFKASINSLCNDDQQMANDLYSQLLAQFDQLARLNPNFKLLQRSRYRDQMYENGVRASFMQHKDEPIKDGNYNWNETPFEVILKERKKDLNIMKGTDQRPLFETDMRITVNFENQVEFASVRNKQFRSDQVRVKDRISYQIGFMRLDATIVETGNQIDYECELEISDTNYLLQWKDDIVAFRSIIRKYLLNQCYISKLINSIMVKLMHEKRATRNGQQVPQNGQLSAAPAEGSIQISQSEKEAILSKFKQRNLNNFRKLNQYTKTDISNPKSIVGDYLSEQNMVIQGEKVNKIQ